VRVTVEDGSWGLARASSNKPELVVVVESPVSERRMRDMFEAMDKVLAQPSRGRRIQSEDLRSNSSLPGLDPAIHPFRKMRFVKIDGYAGQARA